MQLSTADLERLTNGSTRSTSQPSLPISLSDGLSPDEAAVIAVLANPSLRAERSRLAVSSAQLIQAKLLPNPQLTANLDPVVGGNTTGTTTGYGVGLDWEISALISRDAKVAAAQQGSAAVRLDVAWKEWQTAEAARLALFDLIATRAQLAHAREVDGGLSGNLRAVRDAFDKRLKTVVEVVAAEAASQTAHASVLTQERELARQRGLLNRALGLPPAQMIEPEASVRLPSQMTVPATDTLIAGLTERRLDLLGLRRGYDAQESTLRAAVLAQFPKVGLGFNYASDTSDVHTLGFGVTIDLPIFDQNQGVIATENATRQQLHDEYADRLFAARADVAAAVSDIDGLGREIAAAESAATSLETLVNTYRKAAEARNVDVATYYTAWSDLAQKQGEVLKLKQTLVQSTVALELAAGVRIAGLGSGLTRVAPATRTSEERAP